MSREKECKCCHEWWYASVIKEDLCPNCYDYFKQLKQQLAETEQKFLEFQEDSIRNEQTYVRELAEKDKEIAHLKEKDNYHLRYELAGADETITNLKRQLEEKDKDKTQLALQELEKVKTLIQNAINFEKPNFVEVYDAINKQINELKGESK